MLLYKYIKYNNNYATVEFISKSKTTKIQQQNKKTKKVESTPSKLKSKISFFEGLAKSTDELGSGTISQSLLSTVN